MRTKNQAVSFSALLAILLVSLCPGVADAQYYPYVCDVPETLGLNGPEMCVNIYFDDQPGGSFAARVMGTTLPVPQMTIGEYDLSNLVFSTALGSGGLGVAVLGTVTRNITPVGLPAGIQLNVAAATDFPVTAASGSLRVFGQAFNASNVHVGGRPGYPDPALFGGPNFTMGPSWLVTCEDITFGPGALQCLETELPVDPGPTAMIGINYVQMNVANDTVNLGTTQGARGLQEFHGALIGTPPPFDFSPGACATLTVNASFNPLENRVAAAAPGPDPDMWVLSLWNTGPNMNHIGVSRVPPPYDGSGIVWYPDIDGPAALYGPHKICRPGANQAVVGYMKLNAGNYDVYTAEYNGTSWSTSPVPLTSADDYHTVTCFETTDGLFLKTYNNTDGTVEILRRIGPAAYSHYDTIVPADVGGTLGSPWDGNAIGQAGYVGAFGTGYVDRAAVNIGMNDGSLVTGIYRTNPPGIIAYRNVGPASGETTVYYYRDGAGYSAAAGWQDAGSLRHTWWQVGTGPSGAPIDTLGTIQEGTNPWQGLDGVRGPNGLSYTVADKGYVVAEGPSGPVRKHISGLPFTGLGGPIALDCPPETALAFVAGPGDPMGQVLVVCELDDVFHGDFERGTWTRWNPTAP